MMLTHSLTNLLTWLSTTTTTTTISNAAFGIDFVFSALTQADLNLNRRLGIKSNQIKSFQVI